MARHCCPPVSQWWDEVADPGFRPVLPVAPGHPKAAGENGAVHRLASRSPGDRHGDSEEQRWGLGWFSWAAISKPQGLRGLHDRNASSHSLEARSL